MRLETRALHWLMYTRDCLFALRERSPRHCCGEPDALGVTRGRYLIEVEIKRTMSDFRANAKKWHVAGRDWHLNLAPREFWFLLPAALVAKAATELPPFAGLLSDDGGKSYCREVVAAPKNTESKRLSVKECVKLARCLGNNLMAAEKRCDSRYDTAPWQELALDDYEI
jgi:hypothetical protein